jgi:anti-sigma-K factor RskA
MINVALLSVTALLIAFGVLGMVMADPIMDIQEAEAQQNSGDITAASEGQPFGGEKMGTITVDSDGRRTNVSADINASPNEGNVYEGWLVDAEGSGYRLSLGQFRNGTLDFSQYMVNPYTYKNFELTEEPAEDSDPNAAESIAGFELQTPFGR